MPQDDRIRFATDLCTFYDPRIWGGEGGYADIGSLFEWGTWNEERFWHRILTDVASAGLDGIEITFSPGDWRSALRAFGSASAFRAEVERYGLEVCAGFLSSRIPGFTDRMDLADSEHQPHVLALVDQYAAFLAECGASTMVTALTLRQTRLADPPFFADIHHAIPVADTLNRMGAICARHGVTLALHPEAFTVLRNARDVDLFMLLTDPTYVGLCPDTAQFTVGGSDPVTITDRHRDRVVLTHWKDAIGAAPPDVEIDDRIFQTQIQWFAQVGQGIVDWHRWARTLRDMNYRGWAVFELDGALDPPADLRAIRQYVETSLGSLIT